MAETHTGFGSWDLALARWGGDHATAGSARAMRDVSLLGGTTGVIAAALLVAALSATRRRWGSVVGFLTVVVAGQFAVANLIKVAVGRHRPDLHQLTGFSGSSFPSGHATAAAATYGAAALLLGRGRSRRTRDALAAVAVAIAVAVASSRVLLGVHWFTDVLAGMAVGWLWLAVCSIAFGGRFLHFGAPVAAAEEAEEAAGSAVDAGPAAGP
jgi:undecaprenyl-diphosphatase